MVELRKLEHRMRAALIRELGESGGESLWSMYLRARDKIFDHVLPGIPAKEPNLTDHTARHIANVLDNAHYLLGPNAFDAEGDPLSAGDAYSLCLSILFHDVGNVFRRSGHEKRIAEIYSWVREGEKSAPGPEGYIVAKVGGAHTGVTKEGNRDTVGALPTETQHIEGLPVHLREIAAILRLADELAEGPHRSPAYVRDVLGYPPESELHHRYAEITHVAIDRGTGRIALTYNVRLDNDGKSSVDDEVRGVGELLAYTFKRIGKVDQERQYTRFYSTVLEPFKRTTVQFNFWIRGDLTELDLEPLTLSDLVIPGTHEPSLAHSNERYEVGYLCDRLKKMLAVD